MGALRPEKRKNMTREYKVGLVGVGAVGSEMIKVLKDPNLRPNSKEKYEAAKELIRHVDFEFTREVKTLNEIFYYRDALIDTPAHEDRTITFYYPYEGHYVRLTFYTYKNAVLRVRIDEK